MNKEKVKVFCDEFDYPFIVLHGLEKSFLGVAEFWNGHKVSCYDKDLLWKCLYDAGLPPDIVEEKMENFFSFWEEIQKQDEVFKDKEEGLIKFHLPLLISRIKDGISPLLKDVVWEEKDSTEFDLKETIEENDRKYKESERTSNIIKDAKQLLDAFE